MIPELAKARHELLALVADLRPELHRYCARLTGSILDGEDLVQEALARAFYALSMSTDVPPLRPWLFRIAHNAAIDHLRRARKAPFDPDAELEAADDTPDPEIARLALGAFLPLPVRQRSAVILKDVLGLSLDEIAAAIDATVPAVKAALVRGRAALRAGTTDEATPRAIDPHERELLARYVALFNARDWTGLQALLADDARLDLVSQARREGRAVGQYFGRYAGLTDLRAEVGALDGQPAIFVHEPASSPHPAYVIVLAWHADRVTAIRDYRYVPYLTASL